MFLNKFANPHKFKLHLAGTSVPRMVNIITMKGIYRWNLNSEKLEVYDNSDTVLPSKLEDMTETRVVEAGTQCLTDGTHSLWGCRGFEAMVNKILMKNAFINVYFSDQHWVFWNNKQILFSLFYTQKCNLVVRGKLTWDAPNNPFSQDQIRDNMVYPWTASYVSGESDSEVDMYQD
jgi:hypothetical protein